MRCAYLIAVYSLGLCMAADAVMAQQSYQAGRATNYGFAARPDNWQPAAAPNWYQQPQANPGQQPIGSGVQSDPRSGYAPVGTVGPEQSTNSQYPTAQYPTAQYPTAQYPTAQYPTAQFPTTQYPTTQFPTGQGRADQPTAAMPYSPPMSLPSVSYSGVPNGYAGNPAFGTASGRLFEASAHDANSLGGPVDQAPAQHAPMYGTPQYAAPTYGGGLQNEVIQGGPAAQYWSNGAEYGGLDKGPIAGPTYSTPASRWFGGVYALLMTRDQENNVWLSYNTNDIHQRLLSSHDANANYAGGVETRFGRYFGCGSNAFEVVYWGIYPGTQETNVWGRDLATGSLDTIMHFDGISYDPGAPQLVSSAFYQAELHRLRRGYNLQNVELNLLGMNFAQNCGCANVNLAWAAGLRYVRFDEDFLYSAAPYDPSFYGAPEEVHYGIDTKNDMFGCQFGGRASVCFKPGFSSFVDTKVGVFVNRSSQHSQIFGANGLAEISDLVSPDYGTPINFQANRTSTAFLAEIRAGLNYQFSCHWSGTIGYRALGLTGVALSTNQIPVDYISAVDSMRTVRTNGCLIAHGAFVGLNYCF